MMSKLLSLFEICYNLFISYWLKKNETFKKWDKNNLLDLSGIFYCILLYISSIFIN